MGLLISGPMYYNSVGLLLSGPRDCYPIGLLILGLGDSFIPPSQNPTWQQRLPGKPSLRQSLPRTSSAGVAKDLCFPSCAVTPAPDSPGGDEGQKEQSPRPCCTFLVIIFPDLSRGLGRSKPNCTFVIFKDSFYLSHCDWLPALIIKSFCFILFRGPMIKGLYISGIFRPFCCEIKKYNTELRKILKATWGGEFDFHDQKDRHVDFSYFLLLILLHFYDSVLCRVHWRLYK